MQPVKTALIGMSPAELCEVAIELGEKPMRGKQLAKHLYELQTPSFASMTDLPQSLRETLESQFALHPLQIAKHLRSSDGVEKLLVHNGDHQVYECVLLPYEDRVSCCISTQVGCPMGCTFCATGLGGFDRNLSAGEIVSQYLLLQQLTKRRISHIVFMGMGEPLLNLPNVLKAVDLFHQNVGLSLRHITISTVGLVPQIDQLAQEKLPIHLALSLHSAVDSVRDKLMPVNHKWPVAEVFAAMRRYHNATGRKITLEYLLIQGVNDSDEQARALGQLVKGVPNVINIIPFNWVDTGYGYKRPTREQVQRFKRSLKNMGCNVTERVERGHDIAAACGQLAGEHQGRFAHRGTPIAVNSASR